MSFQAKPPYGPVVVCDLCERFGAICDRSWREMRAGDQPQPIHLCRACQKIATWCHIHQRYHHPGANHRRPCIECGGLFTTQVALQIERCPSCRRRLPAPSPAHTSTHQRSYKRIIAKLLAPPGGFKS